MNTESIARRFERRPGYELIDYAPVALPIYRLTVDAVTMAHREIPPIKEFVMRCVAMSLDSENEVAAFLGLDSATVGATFDQLRTERYVVTAEDGSGAALLDQGRQVLAKARESSPQDEMLVFLFDRLLRKPIQLGAQELLAPVNVDPQLMIEIRSYPADGPEIEDLSMPEVLQVLEQQVGGRAAFGRDLLRLKRIVRRVRLYRPAVGLVYKKVRSSDIQIAFIVDDARHEGLEHAFAIGGGPKKMMGWTAPALRHRCAITWSSLNATTRGAVRYASYHDRVGYCEARVSGPRGRRCRRGRRSQEASSVGAATIFRSPCTMPDRDRGVRNRAPLGA